MICCTHDILGVLRPVNLGSAVGCHKQAACVAEACFCPQLSRQKIEAGPVPAAPSPLSVPLYTGVGSYLVDADARFPPDNTSYPHIIIRYTD